MTRDSWSRCASAFVLTATVASTSVHAEALSRGGAVERALRQNPQLAAARAVEAQSAARGKQADAAQYPSVNLTLGAGPSLKAQLVPGTGALSTANSYGDVGLSDLSIALGGQLQVIQPLYTFGKIRERQSAAAHELQARQAQTQMTGAQLALAVAQLYEGLLFARDAELFFQELTHWLERSAQDTQREIAGGGGAREQDLLRMQSALGAALIGWHQASAAKRQAEAGLAAYLALPSGASIEPKETALELLPRALPDRSALIARAVKHRPELRALVEGAAAYDALANAEAAGNYPDFFALLFADGAYTPGRELATSRYVRDPLNGFYPGLLVGARWTFTGAMASQRASEDHAKARELAELKRWADAGVPAEVTKAFEDAQRAKADDAESETAVAIAKRWSVQASADYAVGLGDVRELTDATQAYVQLRMASFDAKYRHNIAFAELERAVGGFHAFDPNALYPSREE